MKVIRLIFGVIGAVIMIAIVGYVFNILGVVF